MTGLFWLVALAFTVFAILYLAGLWQYACDELRNAWSAGWRDFWRFFK